MNPFYFQMEGAEHLQSGRVKLLADEMGLGKTLQAIIASEDRDNPVTVISPAILRAEWRDEYQRWGDIPRDVAVVGQKRGPCPQRAAVTLCSYDMAARPEVAAMLQRRRNAHVILDECHYLKEPSTKRTKVVLGGKTSPGIVHRASRVSFLTGTPLPNHAGELFPMLRVAGLYDRSHYDFLHDFCVVRNTPFGEKITGYKNAEALRDLLVGFMLRRLNVVELPPTEYGEIAVEPTEATDPHALSIIANLDPDTAKQIEYAAKEGNFDRIATPHLATLRRAVGLAKAPAIADRAYELLASDRKNKLVLFAFHRDVISILSDELLEFGPVQLDGSTPEKQRKLNKDRFQSDPDCRVAVCQLKAAGTGLTLTAANNLWLVEPSWTPAENDQAVKRIVRIGQKRSTSIKFISLENSIDQAINKVLREKRQLIDEIMNSTCD